MRRSIFAAWALALTASSAHAFLPVPSAAPALISLRPAGPVASRQGLVLQSAGLSKVTRANRKLAAPLKMVIANSDSPAAERILSTAPYNNPEIFEKTYDMVIFGGGPTGLTAALSAVAQGRTVVVVDPTAADKIPFSSNFLSNALGRTGTPITDYSTMTYRAALMDTALDSEVEGSDWKAVQRKMDDMFAVNYDINVVAMNERAIPHVRGNAFLHGMDSEKVWNVNVKGLANAGDGVIKARKVLVASGSSSIPAQNVVYNSDKGVFNGDSIQDLNYFPKTMTIVGNALTALEYAKSFSALGTTVTLIIQNRDKFNLALSRAAVSSDICSKLMSQLKDQGVTIVYDDNIASVDSSRTPAEIPVTVTLDSGKTIETNALVTLLGRVANVGSLGLESDGVGVALNQEGSVLVDHNLETTATGVYASGDVVGGPWMPNNGLDQVHSAVVRMFGLETMAVRSMPERHAGFLAKSYNSNGYAGMMDSAFPGVVSEEAFIEVMTGVVGKYGFNPDSSINLVSTCRDEICRPFTEKLDSMWGQHFNIASLGGFVFCGKTGFGAGMAHAPVDNNGKERYVFWAMPHIAYGIQHIAGKVFRSGRDGPSNACGALIALKGEITNAKLSVGLDPSDTEMSLLRQQVLGKLEYGQVPNLVGITYASHDCILEQVRSTAEAVINPDTCEYVIISSIQIHGALNKNFMWPGTVTMYSGGVETDLTPTYLEDIKDWKLDAWLQAEALAQVQSNSKGGRLPAIFDGIKL